tara:strand:+ start:392 stop:1828 length:1437 start_codon:yes stop_codon:yes gene_type:complete
MFFKNELILNFLSNGILLYGAILALSYIILSVISAIETNHYLKKNSFVNYTKILASPFAPTISIIAPAYNESLTIIENVRSLLSIQYVNYEVLLINDGSTDDSLKKLIEAYALTKVNYSFNRKLPTEKVRAVYRSTIPAFKRLLVIDKENGGKADALNLGLNISDNNLVACIDVDCILEPDALLKMVKPFLENENEEKVIAAGGVIRVANSCVVKDGKLLEVKLPKKFLAKSQVLEYMRSFLLGRMAWSKLNGLLLVSGALGLFDRKTMIAAGGYNKIVGEDLELVTRIRKYMDEKGEKYKVVYIPDPLCWTEVPENYKILGNQRIRWTRGLIETLIIHKNIFFNSSYGILGVISYPYWFFYEWLAPIVEFVAIIYFIFLIVFNLVNWDYFILLTTAVYAFAVMFSALSILSEELTYHQYSKKGVLFKLIIIVLLEPLVFHPYVMWSSVKGNFNFVFNRKKKDWGEMTRTGFKGEVIP